MPLFYHGAAAVVKMDFCLFGGFIGCIITHGKKVQKRCNISIMYSDYDDDFIVVSFNDSNYQEIYLLNRR